MDMDLRDYLRKHHISFSELAGGVGLKRSTVGNKLLGIRPWSAEEALAVVRFLRKRTGEPVTVEYLFQNGKAA
jgi:hypothetical protein